MSSKFRDQLIKLQKKSYLKNLRLIEQNLNLSNSVKKYSREYKRHLKSFEGISSTKEVISAILESNIVYHGDYHTLKQSQRSVLRVLREIIPKRKIILCLEMFHSKDQYLIDKYMSGKLTEKVFLKKIDYANKWGFSWKNWKPIISLCKKNKIPILGINFTPDTPQYSLIKRDKFSAKNIAKAVIRNPDTLLYVVDGDYHISPDHLPKRVFNILNLLDIKVKRTIVYQNAANLYWKLAESHLEETDVLKITDESFCIMNSIPANKHHSYLNWLNFMEDDDAYYPGSKDWTDQLEEFSHTSIPELVKTICNILDLDTPEKSFNDLSVYYGNSTDFLKIVEDISEISFLRSYLKAKFARGEGFLMEYSFNNSNNYIIYLPNSSLNMAAEEASHFIHSVFSGSLTHPLGKFDDFYRNILVECLGFFGSKLINEKRKTDSLSSLKRFVESLRSKRIGSDEREKLFVAQTILNHHKLEKKSVDPLIFAKNFKSLYNSRSHSRTVITTQMGYMLGTKLFRAVKKGKFDIASVRELFKMSFSKPGEAFLHFIELSSQFFLIKINNHN